MVRVSITKTAQDATWYALDDFYNCIRDKKLPSSNVMTGGTTAVCVHLANEAMYSHSVQQWKTDYNFQV